jgi:superoxide dismutase
VHHQGHHQGYTDKLNQGIDALKGLAPELAALPLDELLTALDKVPEKVRGTIRNSGGGYVNHADFWYWMAPNAGGPAGGEVGAAIDRTFGSFDRFKEDFSAAAATVFGSGWAWLIVDYTGGRGPELRVVPTSNQDTPAMEAGKYPILGLVSTIGGNDSMAADSVSLRGFLRFCRAPVAPSEPHAAGCARLPFSSHRGDGRAAKALYRSRAILIDFSPTPLARLFRECRTCGSTRTT